MNYIAELLAELTSRLPELEWKVGGLGAALLSRHLPRGLFRATFEFTGTHCVAEIKEDIRSLSTQNNERSAQYLAERIHQKINVLVALCQIDSRKKKPEKKVSFGIDMLSTRQQWIGNLEHDIATLYVQQQAMTKALEQLKTGMNTAAILSLQAELGEVEKRLTLAQETLSRAVS